MSQQQQSWSTSLIVGLILAALVYIVYVWVRLVIPVELIEVRKAFDLPMTSAGFLATIHTLGIAIPAIPFGFLVVRYGTRLSLFLGAVVFSLGIAWPPFGLGLGDLAAAQVVSGMGEGLYNVALFSLIGGLSAKYRGTLTGCAVSTFGIGMVTGPIVISNIMVRTGDWRAAFFILAVSGIIGAVFLFVALRGHEIMSDRRTGPITIDRLRRVLVPRNIAVCAVGALNGFAMNAFTAVFMTFLRTRHEMDMKTAGAVMSLFGIGLICGGAPSGYIADKIGRKNFLLIALIGCALFSTLAFWAPSTPWVLAALAFGYGWGENSTHGSVYALIQDQVEKQDIPIGTGVMATIYFLTAAVSGYLIVAAREALGWEWGSITIFVLSYAVASIIMLWLMSGGRGAAKAEAAKPAA